jgi:hypothetical protein
MEFEEEEDRRFSSSSEVKNNKSHCLLWTERSELFSLVFCINFAAKTIWVKAHLIEQKVVIFLPNSRMSFLMFSLKSKKKKRKKDILC